MLMATNGPYALMVQPDDILVSPREVDEHFGTMVCFHPRYASHVEHIKQLALPICKVCVTFEDGFTTTLPYGNHRRKINEGIAKHGYPCSMRYAPESKQELAQILKREHLQRDRQAVPGDFHSYLCKLEQSSVHKQLRATKSIVTTVAHLHDNKDMPEL